MNLDYEKVLNEIQATLSKSNFSDLKLFVDKILTCEQIVVYGAGRVGLVMKSFSMRLDHLGLKSFFLGDSNVPKVNDKDLLIIGSGSGRTPSVKTIVDTAEKNGLNIICITADKYSAIANSSVSVLIIDTQTKDTDLKLRSSVQPMTTLFEQALLITLDSIILMLMSKLNETHETMVLRHNILE
jgi:6-phospho-3-hexuloisomerase